ncbi:MAG TPA: lanthionine synthetase LanC family protein [Streptosporangiaceae bacterium]|jgi:lantibiotic modifying enzyme|nr:lanthionine synthetase LanC family protein [Streptosporangiaceae bacterium]
MAGRPDLADAVRDGFGWVGSEAVETDGGLAWLDDGVLSDGLYSGTAGVLLACAEAAAAGHDTASVAAGARDRLLHLARHGPEAAMLTGDGLFLGWSGVSVALLAWARAAGDAAAAGAAERVTEQFAARVLLAGPGRSGRTDIISGDAGIVLALIADASDAALRAASVLAGRLAAAAEPAPGGLHWRMNATYKHLMPGFSHGTAGAAYALAAAGNALGRRDLVRAASQGADALIAAGDHPGGWAVPATIPAGPDSPLCYGWCHGPTGTARLFVLLDQIDPQPRWRHALDACLRALRDSRLPARLYPGYWDNLARCCGTAGVGQFLLDRYQATADPALLNWAGTLAADVLDHALTTPRGVTWSNTEHTVSPPELPPEPGLMQGAAGIAGWLARLGALRANPGSPVAFARPGPSWL